jgi:hypothetical protein
MFDKFTHFVLLEPVSAHVTGEQLLEILERRVVRRFGLMDSISSDNDVAFSAVYKQSWQARGVRLYQTTKDHSAANGAVEKANGLAEAFVRNYVSLHQLDWVSLLPDAEGALNNRYVVALKMTPFYAVHGYEYRTAVTRALSVESAQSRDRHMSSCYKQHDRKCYWILWSIRKRWPSR